MKLSKLQIHNLDFELLHTTSFSVFEALSLWVSVVERQFKVILRFRLNYMLSKVNYENL